jgi:osmotically-inducible protein OsmY
MPFRAAHDPCKRASATSRPVPDVARQAARRLNDSAYQQLRGVRCDYHEGVLTLRGQVSSFYLKQVAQTVVRKLPGVEECVNRIEVALPRGFRGA